MFKKLFFVLLVLSKSLLFCPAVSAQAIPDDPAVTIGKLSNGLTYYIRQNTESKNRAVLYNVDKLIAAVLEEIEKIKTKGPTATDLDKFKAAYRHSLELGLRSNEFWLNYLSSKLRDDEAVFCILSEDERRDKLKPEEIKSAAARYFSGENYFKAVLVPEKQ